MPKDTSIKSVLLIGSGPIVIGQACEFDYSGSQASRSLRNEGIEVTLINSNPATIMTDPVTADNVYLMPLTTESIEKILKKHKIDAVLPTMGGQTALNLAIECEKLGIWNRTRRAHDRRGHRRDRHHRGPREVPRADGEDRRAHGAEQDRHQLPRRQEGGAGVRLPAGDPRQLHAWVVRARPS
jgi:hypothetical protein